MPLPNKKIQHRIFYIFVKTLKKMAEIRITNKEWERVKIKIQRKYNHLTDSELQYTEGQEDNLISRLMELVNRDRKYVVFTLQKALVNIDNNRL
ncbi:MAG: hypothetical protein JWR67_1862 [Mucilaginibacter sp.]|nr:hypothetical protein [Mucilaginibacter sp.]MDB5110748.1 hypothetical protein [Mucilaginibacter sp.]